MNDTYHNIDVDVHNDDDDNNNDNDNNMIIMMVVIMIIWWYDNDIDNNNNTINNNIIKNNNDIISITIRILIALITTRITRSTLKCTKHPRCLDRGSWNSLTGRETVQAPQYIYIYLSKKSPNSSHNYSRPPRMCVLSTLCGNVDKHSPLYIYIYINIYIFHNIYKYIYIYCQQTGIQTAR